MTEQFRKVHTLISKLPQSELGERAHFAQSLLPQELLANPEHTELREAILPLAASSLTAVEMQFGTDPMNPGVINGAVEKDVLATYHNGVHTRLVMMRDSLAYAIKRREVEPDSFSDQDLLLLLFAASCHDIVQGNGRGNDERQSAELAVSLMEDSSYQFTAEDKAKVHGGILATSFNPKTNAQSVDAAKPHLNIQQAIAIGDLLTLCRPDGPALGIAHSIEFMSTVEGPYDRVFVTEAQRHNFPIQPGTSLQECLEFIDRNETLHATFGRYLSGQTGFYRNHKYPDGRVDEWFPGREQNAVLQENIAQLYASGKVTAVQAYESCLYQPEPQAA